MFSLALADLEADVESTARLERRPQPLQCWWNLERREVKQAGASPYAVIMLLRVNVGEGLDGDRLTEMV